MRGDGFQITTFAYFHIKEIHAFKKLSLDNDSPKTLIVITGPTASGKTAAAIELARNLNTVIISADSRQFYREMSIGTAKPTDDELTAVKHHFINSHSIVETFTAGDYEKQCLELLNDLFKTHNKVLLVGGSGLFIKAICEGFDEFPDVTPGVRDKLNRQFKENGIGPLQEQLKQADPEYYGKVDVDNPQRVIRALEVFEGTGIPYSTYRKAMVNKRPFGIVKLGLSMERAALYQRINQRVDDMLSAGLAQEARSLIPYRHLNALNTVGYSELFNYFDGKTDLKMAIDLIKQNTRRFAKRQITWFKKDTRILWFQADNKNLLSEMQLAISNIYKQS